MKNQVNMMNLCERLLQETDKSKLLYEILLIMCSYTGAEGAHFYMIEDNHLDYRIIYNERLHVNVGYHNDTMNKLPPMIPIVPQYIECAVASTGKVFNIPDIYEDDQFDYIRTLQYDITTKFKTKSMLAIPLKDTKEKVIGVLKLMNARDEDGTLISFTKEVEEAVLLLSVFATMLLFEQQHEMEAKRLMYSFCTVMIGVIDERTPVTASHTTRIVQLLLGVLSYIKENEWAEEITGPFSANREEVIIMSALVHDIGKLRVPLDIINKATRLHDGGRKIKERFRIIDLLTKIELLEGKITQEIYDKTSRKVREYASYVQSVNEARFVTPQMQERITEISLCTYRDETGEQQFYLTEEEVESLFITKGTLTKSERACMEEHAGRTKEILSKIQFGERFQNVAEFASAHHERLNGTGYPLGLEVEEIPVDVQIVAVLDIFEGMTTSERPYKKALSVDQAFQTLYEMADSEEIDFDIVRILEQSRAWENPITMEHYIEKELGRD